MLGKAFIMLATMHGGDGKPVKPPVVKPAPVVATAPVKVTTPTPTPKTTDTGKPVIDADYVVGKLQEYYQRIKHYKATFHQTVTNATFGTKAKSYGRVFIKKPGKMRWDYQSPTRNSYISDGARLWSVDTNKKQVIKKDLRKYVMSVAVTFLYGKGDLRRDFRAELLKNSTIGEKGQFVVRLKPRVQDARYQTLTLVIDPNTYEVKKSIVVTTQGETNSISFSNPDTTSAVKDGWFTFNEKAFKGKYKIIDMDKHKPGK